MHTPTHEQTAATEAFPTGAHLVIQAGAGTGKTTTLGLLARTARRLGRRGRYIAFNRAVARHAASAFPAEVTCGTAHALAYTAVGRNYQARMKAPRQAGWRTGAALGIDEGMSLRLGARKVTHRALSHTVLRTVTRFCQSADEELAPHHVPPCAEPKPSRCVHSSPSSPFPTRARPGPISSTPITAWSASSTTTTSRCGRCAIPSSRRTSCSSTRHRTPTPSSSRSSPPSTTTLSWCWSGTPPRPSTAGAAHAT